MTIGPRESEPDFGPEHVAASGFRLSRWLPGLPWKGWANTWPLGRHWRIDVEWIPAGRSFDFWIYDRRRNDGR